MKNSLYSPEYKMFLMLLRAAREQAGLTQNDLARSLDVPQSFVSKCETGERRMDITELRSWCAALGISFYRFVERFDLDCKS